MVFCFSASTDLVAPLGVVLTRSCSTSFLLALSGAHQILCPWETGAVKKSTTLSQHFSSLLCWIDGPSYQRFCFMKSIHRCTHGDDVTGTSHTVTSTYNSFFRAKTRAHPISSRPLRLPGRQLHALPDDQPRHADTCQVPTRPVQQRPGHRAKRASLGRQSPVLPPDGLPVRVGGRASERETQFHVRYGPVASLKSRALLIGSARLIANVKLDFLGLESEPLILRRHSPTCDARVSLRDTLQIQDRHARAILCPTATEQVQIFNAFEYHPSQPLW